MESLNHTHNSRYLKAVVGFGIFFLVILLISLITNGVINRTNKTQSQADDPEIARVKEALNSKPLSTVCQEEGATQAISFADQCDEGQFRLSDNPNDPRYYCCR